MISQKTACYTSLVLSIEGGGGVKPSWGKIGFITRTKTRRYRMADDEEHISYLHVFV